jgi:hypothetical protein
MLIEAKGVNGQVTFDGSFVTITRKGFAARATVGKGEKRIPVASIAAVQWKAPGAMTRGFIQFTVPGGSERRSQFGSQTTDAAKDENSVLVAKGQVAEFEALREAIEGALASPAASAAPALSVGDELRKLAELRDAGALTDEEFNAQKAKLLG